MEEVTWVIGPPTYPTRTLDFNNHRLILILNVIMSHKPYHAEGVIPILKVVLMALANLEMKEAV